jgi:hypothetical protein
VARYGVRIFLKSSLPACHVSQGEEGGDERSRWRRGRGWPRMAPPSPPRSPAVPVPTIPGKLRGGKWPPSPLSSGTRSPPGTPRGAHAAASPPSPRRTSDSWSPGRPRRDIHQRLPLPQRTTAARLLLLAVEIKGAGEVDSLLDCASAACCLTGRRWRLEKKVMACWAAAGVRVGSVWP